MHLLGDVVSKKGKYTKAIFQTTVASYGFYGNFIIMQRFRKNALIMGDYGLYYCVYYVLFVAIYNVGHVNIYELFQFCSRFYMVLLSAILTLLHGLLDVPS